MLSIKPNFLKNPCNFFTIIIEKSYVFCELYSFDFLRTTSNFNKLRCAFVNYMKGILCR